MSLLSFVVLQTSCRLFDNQNEAPYDEVSFASFIHVKHHKFLNTGRKEEGHVLFNDALNTLYGVRHMVKNHSNRETERKPAAATCPTLSHRQDSTYYGLCYTSRGALAGTINSSMRLPRRIDPTTYRTMSERSYHGGTSRCF